MSWSLIAEQVLEGGQSIILPTTITAPVLVIEASTEAEAEDETVPGYARAIASFSEDSDPFDSVDFDRVSISLVHPQFFEVTQQFVTSYQIELVLYDFITFPVKVKVWAIEGAELPLSGSGQNGGGEVPSGGGDSGSGCRDLMPLVAVPNSFGNVVGPGLAVFTAGHTEFNFGTDEYTQTYSVESSAFWKIGARSVAPITSGRVRFGLGSGRAVVGLAEQFTDVDFRLVPWAWYVHNFEEIRAFDYVNGSASNRGAFPWSADKELALRVDGGTVFYEVQTEDGWEIAYTSPNPVSNPLYFCAVLGPQSFVFNCSTEEI